MLSGDSKQSIDLRLGLLGNNRNNEVVAWSTPIEKALIHHHLLIISPGLTLSAVVVA